MNFSSKSVPLLLNTYHAVRSLMSKMLAKGWTACFAISAKVIRVVERMTSLVAKSQESHHEMPHSKATTTNIECFSIFTQANDLASYSTL
jgi:hypothetical protein